MPFQSAQTLTAFFMERPMKKAVEPPTTLERFMFTTLYIEFFQLILVCLDAYIRGAALGYTFRGKCNLLMEMMIEPARAAKYATYLHDIAKKRIDSYDQEIDSIIDFFISTELSKDKLTFDDFLKQAKTKINIDSAGHRIKVVFEEGVLLGTGYPEMVSKLISPKCRISTLDWEKAKILGFTSGIDHQELDLKFLRKWAVHNLRTYVKEYFPELVASLGL